MSARPFPWRTLLFASVALNLLMVGAAIGALGAGVRRERAASGEAVAHMAGPRAFVNALPEEARGPVRQGLARSWTESREARRTAAQARREAYATAMAEPYDTERVRLALARMRAADQAALGVFHDNIADLLSEMTPAERRVAIQALQRPVRRDGASLEDGAALPGGDAGEQQARPADGQTLREQRREAIRERIRERRREKQQ
ncbi:MAG: periplasmic heavy metal sensor [Hyphomonadaceae bacterium]|nr:periplasmic heavy metal sensor [Hyphomonadaceae bacterium]